MADSATEKRTFPAPGSAVPGAPPPLRRPLTPADGALVGPVPETAAVPSDPPSLGVPTTRGVTGARFTVAAALFGIAVGLELADLLSVRSRSLRRGHDRPRSQRPV